MKRRRAALRGFLFAAAIAARAGDAGAAGLTIEPTAVPGDYVGAITLNAAGLSSGESVVVDMLLDANGNGDVDAGEFVLQSFRVADGQAVRVGGVRNRNIPGDDDGAANGRMRTAISFPALPEACRAAAKFIFRMSAVAGGFAPVTASFAISQPTAAQGVSGRVSSGGDPVPSALVFLLDSFEENYVAGAIAAANGTFAINAAPASYRLGAIKSGFLFDLGTAAMVTVNPSSTTTRDLVLEAADRTISGRLADAVTGAGIPGAQMFVQSDTGLVTLAFTGTNGDFSLPVSSSSPQWRIDPSELAGALLGYLTPEDGYTVATGGGNVSGVPIPLLKGTAMIYGSLSDDEATPLAGIGLFAYGGGHAGFGASDAGGGYFIAVAPGEWWVGPDGGDLAVRGYTAPQTSVALAAGEALRLDFVARRFTARLDGRVTDQLGRPVDGVRVSAWQEMGGGENAVNTDGEGAFSLGVTAGRWHVTISGEDAAARGIVSPDLVFDVVDGGNISGIECVVRPVTAWIEGLVAGDTSGPLAAVGVYANIQVGQTRYTAWRQTDESGRYRLGVFNGTWSVGLDCDDLSSRGYLCVTSKAVAVTTSQTQADFVVPRAGTPTPIVTATATPTRTPPIGPRPGDANCDGRIGAADIPAIVDRLPLEVPGACGFADANEDGAVDPEDIEATITFMFRA